MPHGEFLKDSSSRWDSEAAWVLGQLPVLTDPPKKLTSILGAPEKLLVGSWKMISCPCFFWGATRASFRGWMLVLNGPFRHLSRNGKIETNWQGTQNPNSWKQKKQHRMACYRCILQHRQGQENSEVICWLGKVGRCRGMFWLLNKQTICSTYKRGGFVVVWNAEGDETMQNIRPVRKK